MPISFTKYVNITSGVIAAQGVRARQLVTRIFTNNPLVPTNAVVSFTSAALVGSFFGTTSVEYLMAAEYFSFVSKTSTAPQLISYAFWCNSAATKALVYGDPKTTLPLASLVTFTSASLNITLGGSTTTLSLNFSGASSMAAIATIIQTALQAYTAGGVAFTAATCTYDAVNARFIITGGLMGVCPVSILNAGNAASLGFASPLTVFSPGIAAETLTTTLANNVNQDNNFATFEFNPNLALTLAQATEIATWNATMNNMFMFLLGVSAANATSWSAALIGFAGVAMTLSPNPLTDFPELMPGMILAASDYTKNNVSQNYMYQQGPFAVSVSDDADSAAYDLIRTNYYGQTQSAGQLINFYQRGVLMGGSTAPTDMNIYANEIWLKSQIGAGLLTLLLAINQVSTNTVGRSQLVSTIQSYIGQALVNGVISVGNNALTAAQKSVIGSITNDPLAYLQVQNLGYWLDVQFTSSVTQDGRTEYQAAYTLIYAKNNAIRAVNGTHNLV